MRKSCTFVSRQAVWPTKIRCVNSQRSQSQSTEAHQEGKPKFTIPPRIERGSTDILKALASTVKRDPTAARYKYHDDPYLVPLTNVGKRQFAMSLEAGRKAAKWVRQEHSQFFQHRLADPFVESFAPRLKYDENSQVSSEVLRKVISNQEVSNAITVYELMKKKEIAVDPAMEQSLLELLCFYNSEDPAEAEDVEERWYWRGSAIFEKPKNTWRDSGYAEKLFHSMTEKTPEAYSAMLQGMAAYHQADRGWKLYEEMKENGMKLTTDAYNSVIAMVPFMKDEGMMRWEMLQELLQTMSSEQVAPNVGTLNSILQVLSKIALYKISVNYSLSTLAEFRLLGIEPSLATFYYLLNIHYGKRVSGSTILYEMVKYLEDLPEIKIQDSTDVNFFFRAMEVSHEKHVDKELGHRIHALLSKPGNSRLIGDAYRESLYFKHYFQLIAKTETIDNLIAFYHTLVPHVHNPDLAVMEEIVSSVDIHGSIHYLPQIWSDVRLYERTPKEKLAYKIVHTLAKHVKQVPTDSVLSDEDREKRLRFLQTALNIWNSMEYGSGNERNRVETNWAGEPLGDLITIFLKLDAFEKACKIIEKLDREGTTKVSGFPKADDLKRFLEACKQNSRASHALATVNYATEIGYQEASEMAVFVADNIPMDESQRNKLSSIAGKTLFPEL